MSLRFTYSLWAGSGWSSILILTENCPKHVEFHFKNKFEKLVHLVSFIIRNLSRCTVTWTSDSVALCFVTTHWFWLLALLVSGVPKIRIWYFLFWQYDAENRSVSVSVSWSRASLQNADFNQKPLRYNKIQCSFLFTPFCYRPWDITENVACSRSSATVSRNTVLLHNCKSNCCIYKIMSET
jgi:hypothetical protein